ncbi:hypothetical protein AKJ52_02060 [candidate division MSBL1 archaeon SCGC-AAA382C18]|uniref:ABC transporter domain-containing protein n=1 Tax=candidate division MSBL1 archaeon SCGC-AAA382C18 TaxID=1698281 RepID=A0A133VJF7_9EURY|nr:hypothetical protein AKJ52_02060 [candidate division MSBL1 archaeon SCGC-AAA382C18]
MDKNSIKTKNLSCGYGDKDVLKNINLSVKNNEFVGVIGPNASGKSTFLRTIDRVIEPKGGSVFLNQQDIENLDKEDIAKEMSLVPQEFSTNYSFSVLKIVTMGRTPHLGPLEMEDGEDMTIVKEAMEMTDTWELADRSFTELSGGEKQRVIIAKALAQEPSVLLLDEPINHLDINNQLEVLALIKSLSEKGEKTVISTFHDLNIAARYCDSLILLHDKNIHAQGSPEEVLSEENIKEVYGTDVAVRRRPETDCISVTPLSGTFGEKSEVSTYKIHLICGGGTGKLLMHTLIRKGHQVTAGVLSPLDDDYREAQRLGISVVESSPFSSIREETAKRNRKKIDKSDLVILADMPIGNGNLINLRLALEAAENKPVILVEKNSISNRDFTQGKAEDLYSSLREKCATKVRDVSEVLEFLSKNDS